MKYSNHHSKPRAIALALTAACAALCLTQTGRAQTITASTSSTSAWLGTPAYETGPAPTTGSGGTSEDNDNWGGNADGMAGFGALAQAFEVTQPGALANVQLVMAGGPATFKVELYNLGAAPAGYQAAPNSTPTITQINNVGSASSTNLLATGDQFAFSGASGQTLVTLTFSGADAGVDLIPENVYVLSLDPTANADGTWWVRGGVPVTGYNTGEGLNADGTNALQDFEGKTSVRDLDLAVTESAPAVTLLGSFLGPNDPTDAGWINPLTGNSITNDPADSFPTGVAGSYPESLEISATGYGYGSNEVELQFSQAQIAAFNTNSWINFTVTFPPGSSNTPSGYFQIYTLVLNAPGYGYHGQSWANSQSQGGSSGAMPNYGYYSSAPGLTQTVSLDYSSVRAAIIAGGESYLQMTLVGNDGSAAPMDFYLNNVSLSTGPFGTPAPVAPPTLTMQKVTGGLRIFAGSTADTYDREELATSDESQSWIGGSFPVKYSFTIAGDGAQYPGFQTHIFLTPINTLPSGDAPYNNEFAEYQASNNLWLQINGGATGTSTVTANVSWKTNMPNSNPTVVALNITNSTITGTWTLAFNSATTGTLTAPGAAPAAFTISDPTVTADFANPLVAYVGVQANSTAGEGGYHDYSQISITGVAGASEVDNFATDSGLNPEWTINPTAASSYIFVVNPTQDPYWASWTTPANGYGLGVASSLPITAPPGNNGVTGSFVLPESFNGYYDTPAISLQGTMDWALIPYDCLPSYGDPTQTNAFFEIMNPPPAN